MQLVFKTYSAEPFAAASVFRFGYDWIIKWNIFTNETICQHCFWNIDDIVIGKLPKQAMLIPDNTQAVRRLKTNVYALINKWGTVLV